MTNSDLFTLALPAIAGGAVLLAGVGVAYFATRPKRLVRPAAGQMDIEYAATMRQAWEVMEKTARDAQAAQNERSKRSVDELVGSSGGGNF